MTWCKSSNQQLTKPTNQPTNTMQDQQDQQDKPFPIPEPPLWLGMALAALLGGIFVSLIIVLYHITH